METGKSRLYLPEDRSGGGGGGGCRTGNLACKKIRESHSAADEGKSVWRLPQQQFPFPPTADTMKIVSENNAICRRRVGRNFGVAQFICTVDRELCQGCDVWTTTADLSLCIQPPLFVGRTRQSVYFVIIALFVVTIPFCLELQSQTRFASCDKPVFSQRSVLVYTALCASELVFATVSFLLISFPLL